MSDRKRVGVVLFQLGGPDSPAAIEPFLYNLFCDPDIIPLGPLGVVLRKPLAWYISSRRVKTVSHHYDEIGGQSPIRLLTERQARKLAAALQPRVEPRVVIAMRYWHPLTTEAVTALNGLPLDQLVLLPLYPHYSFATTGSSLKEWDRVYRPGSRSLPVTIIQQFYDHPLYIDAVVEKVACSLTHFERPADVHLVFSAHGLPLSLIEKGDPYQRQVEETVRLVMQRGAQVAFRHPEFPSQAVGSPRGRRGGWPAAFTLCYQSKVGRAKWLEPSLTATLEDLARGGKKHLLVIPIAFVTEHIETLHEINIEAREEVEKLGVEQFEMMPAVGDSSRFIATLADLVLRAAGVEAAVPTLVR